MDLTELFSNSVGNIMGVTLVVAVIFGAICVWEMVVLIAREMMNNSKK